MRQVVEALCQRIVENTNYAHPIDLFWLLEPELPVNVRLV